MNTEKMMLVAGVPVLLMGLMFMFMMAFAAIEDTSKTIGENIKLQGYTTAAVMHMNSQEGLYGEADIQNLEGRDNCDVMTPGFRTGEPLTLNVPGDGCSGDISFGYEVIDESSGDLKTYRVVIGDESFIEGIYG